MKKKVVTGKLVALDADVLQFVATENCTFKIPESYAGNHVSVQHGGYNVKVEIPKKLKDAGVCVSARGSGLFDLVVV